MFVKELDFFSESHFDRHFIYDIFLGTVYNTDISEFEVNLLIQ